jgi:hypothetical protein
MTKSLMSNVPYAPAVLTGTGAVTGEILAVPPASTRGSERWITVAVSFSADPGAISFNLMGSLDGTNFATLQNFAVATLPILATIKANVTHVRFDQVSKVNSVTATPLLMVA